MHISKSLKMVPLLLLLLVNSGCGGPDCDYKVRGVCFIQDSEWKLDPDQVVFTFNYLDTHLGINTAHLLIENDIAIRLESFNLVDNDGKQLLGEYEFGGDISIANRDWPANTLAHEVLHVVAKYVDHISDSKNRAHAIDEYWGPDGLEDQHFWLLYYTFGDAAHGLGLWDNIGG